MFFMCFILLMSVSISTQTHPRYSYVCKEDGSVEFMGFKSGSTITMIEHTNSSCNRALTPENGRNVVKIDSNCMGDISEKIRTAKVRVKDGNVHDGSSINESSVHSNHLSKLIGGLEAHTFILTCDTITDVHRTVLRQFHLKDLETLYKKENEIGSVDMRFKGTDNKHAPDISEAFIGDEFYMFLEYKGVSEYKLLPRKCIAYAGNDILSNAASEETLWEYKAGEYTHCVSTKASSLNLMGVEGFTYVDSNEKNVKARLNAFRFNSQNDVTIFCEVSLLPADPISTNKNVCPTPTQPPSPTQPPTSNQAATLSPAPTTQAGRKKRESNSQLNTRVMKTIAIKEKKYDNSNQGTFVTPSLVLQVVSSMVGLIVMKKVSQ